MVSGARCRRRSPPISRWGWISPTPCAGPSLRDDGAACELELDAGRAVLDHSRADENFPRGVDIDNTWIGKGE